MRRTLTLAAALAAACAPHLGPPRVRYGDSEPIRLVSVSTDPGRWYAEIDTGAHGTRLFFLDTGFTYTTCDDRFAEDVGIRPRGRARIRGDAGAVAASRGRLPPMSLGGHELLRLACVVRDLHTTSSIQDPPEVRVAGVLGADVLRRFRVRIDPAAATLVLAPPGEDPLDRLDPATVPIRDEPWFRTRWRVPLDVDGRRAWPIVDTGASRTFLDGERLGLETAQSRSQVVVRATGSAGLTVRDLRFFRPDEARLGPLELPPLLVVDRPRGWFDPGLLGLDALGGLVQDYDFRRRLARFAPADPAIPRWAPPQTSD